MFLSPPFSLSFSVIWRPGWNYDNKRKEKLLLWLLSHYVNDIKQALCVCICVRFLVCIQTWAAERAGACACTRVFMNAVTIVSAPVHVRLYLAVCKRVDRMKMSSSNSVCPGAMGANLRTVITRCQTRPHWLWHVNYTLCFRLLWWHNTHIKRCTVRIYDFVLAWDQYECEGKLWTCHNECVILVCFSVCVSVRTLKCLDN